jgi:hypothetical protein
MCSSELFIVLVCCARILAACASDEASHSPGSGQECTIEIDENGDVAIAAPIECTHRTIDVERDVSIIDGGTFHLVRSTLRLDGDIRVQSGGRLLLESASIRIMKDPILEQVGNLARHNRILVDAGAEMIVTESVL